MKVLVIGGTNFIGPYVIRKLVEMEHQVTVFNRGQATVELPPEVDWLKGDRHNLPKYKSQFQKLAPDVVLDMIPYTAKDAQNLVDTYQDIVPRVVAISSADVYRARDIIWQKETGMIDPIPLTEDSPLRSQLYPYRGLSESPLAQDYDKILVEQVLMNAKNIIVTIVRLPMVYGVGDNWHRLYPYIKRMDNQRPAIVLEETIAHWQGCYGYVENVARAIALAVNEQKAEGHIYNVCESPITELDLVKAIAELVNWQGKILVLPKTQMPATWNFSFNFNQHWITDSTRIRTELNYTEVVNHRDALRQTIAWERKHPPVCIPQSHSQLLDYQDEDQIIATINH